MSDNNIHTLTSRVDRIESDVNEMKNKGIEDKREIDRDVNQLRESITGLQLADVSISSKLDMIIETQKEKKNDKGLYVGYAIAVITILVSLWSTIYVTRKENIQELPEINIVVDESLIRGIQATEGDN